MVDFRKLMFSGMTEEQRANFIFWEKSYQRDVLKFQLQDDITLTMFFLYYWMNSEFHRKFTDRNHDQVCSTYDSALIKVLIPELLMRFMKKTDQQINPLKEPFRRLWDISNNDVTKFIMNYKEQKPC
jgi:hypothetical protein